MVTSRAVAPMDRLSRWSLPLVEDDGLFLAMKGSSAPQELDSAASLIRRLGGVDAHVVTVGEEWLSPPVTVIRIRKTTIGGHIGQRGDRHDHGR